MPEIRFIGGILGSVAVVVALAGLGRHQRRGILRVRDLATLVVGSALLSLGFYPQWFDRLARLVGVESLQGRRLAIVTVLGFGLLGFGLFVAIGRIGRLHDQIGDLAMEVALRTPVVERVRKWEEPSVAVVIPAYNEEESLPDVLRQLPAEVGGYRVLSIVVSDGSTDATVLVASELADVVIERPLRRGSGAAVRTGLAYAIARGSEIVVTIDADGQHDPGEIPLLVEPLIANSADVVQGVRRINSAEVSGHRLRAFGVTFFSWVMRALLGIDTNDPANGFRAIQADAYRRLALTEDQFYVAEFIVRSAREKLRIVEVPVTLAPRSHGQSKKPGVVTYGLGFAMSIVRAVFQSRSWR